MSEDHNLRELLEQIELSTRKQMRFARLQFICTVLAAAVLIIFAITCVRILPQFQEMVTQAEVVLSNLESVTTELAKTDLTGMVENIDALVANVDGLVSTSQSGVEQTMEKINAVDFDALNKAIEDLSAVIEPLAKTVKRFSFG